MSTISLLEWEETLVTGHQQIDKQHQQLFKIVNDVIDKKNKGQEMKAAIPTLMQLTKYSMEHFATEEDLLLRVNPQVLRLHKDIHGSFVDQVKDFAIMAQNGSWSKLSDKMLDFLKAWLKQHIMEQDMRDLKPTER